MHRSLPVLCLALATVAACNPCMVPDSMTPGSVVARIDDQRWKATDGVWFDSGTDLRITTETARGWALTLVLQTTEDGATATEALEAQEFPFDFTISESASGGWALLYPPEGLDLSSADADESGYLTIANQQDNDLLGCFEFKAGRGEEAVYVTDGVFRVPERS
ncbi:MAG: hypothetical protein JXB39_11935 [Deltaproteobacteria bacterium]|nr:hypothetical protein [Deltaproteobacteria bacterium]